MARGERPLDDGDDPVLRFAADLRTLRVKAGTVPYRELARRAHYSAAALSEAAGGRKLPSLAVTVAYVAACDGDTDAWTRRWHDVAGELATETGPDSDQSTTELVPYVGLAMFRQEDADRFFGRERLVAMLVDQVVRHRLVVVVGPSGSGKSSVLRAGLLHHAHVRAVLGVPGGPAVVFTPGVHPLEECAARLAAVVGTDVGSVLASLRQDSRGLHLVGLQAGADQSADRDLLVLVDQFEELFTLCDSEVERQRFIDLLHTAASADGSRTRVVVSVRADFYAHCLQYPELVEALRDAQVVVGPMRTSELRATITQPALRAGYRVENSLLSQLIADVTGQPGVLPLLSHALLETWRRRRGNTMTLNGYLLAGGIADSIARAAEAVYGELTEVQQNRARHLFTRLVVLGDGTEDTKRRLDTAELDADDPDTMAVLAKLAAARLVTLDHATIEIAHEALIRSWPRLRAWLSDDRDSLRAHRALTVAAGAWQSAGHDPELLYRGTRLADAEERFDIRALTKRERDFLQHSLQERARQQAAARRQTRRLRTLLALATVMLVVAATTTGFALSAQRSSNEQRVTAVARNALSQAAALRDLNPALALQLDLATYRISGLPEARAALVGAFATPYAARLTGHTNAVTSVAFSPSGDSVVSASSDHTLRLWSPGPGHPRQLAVVTLPDIVQWAGFSPDGHVLAARVGGAVRLYDVTDRANPRDLATLPAPDGLALSFGTRFSPDGRWFVGAGANGAGDGILSFWDITDPDQPSGPTLVAAGTGRVTQLAFSPDGHVLASANATSPDYATSSHELRLWDVSDPRRPVELTRVPGFTAPVAVLRFSTDGRTLVAGQAFSEPTLFDTTDPHHPQPLPRLGGQVGEVTSASFSPDGHTLALGTSNRTTRLWDLTDPRRPQPVTTFTGSEYGANDLAYSPDGHTLAFGAVDGTVRLEDTTPFDFAVRAHGPTYMTMFSPDGTTLATGYSDGSIELSNTADPYHPRRLGEIVTGSRTEIFAMAFSPDGHSLAAASLDGTAGLWNVADPSRPEKIALVSTHDSLPPTSPSAVAISPDGRALVVGYLTNSVQLWDISDPRHPIPRHTITNLPGIAYALDFRPGSALLAVGAGNDVRFYDLADLRAPRMLGSTAPGGRVNTIDWHPDGHTLLILSSEPTMGLWDVADPARPRLTTSFPLITTTLRASISPDSHTVAAGTNDHIVELWDITGPNPRRVASLTSPTPSDIVAFSPTNNVVATAGAERLTPGSFPHLWDTDTDRIAAHLCDTVWPRITPTEWTQYFPGLPYQPPCP